MRTLLKLFCLFALFATQASADPVRGRLLYENQCISCHESGVHIRQMQTAQSLAEIRAQVDRWQENTGLGWGAQEIDDVVEHLNAAWYHYPGGD